MGTKKAKKLEAGLEAKFPKGIKAFVVIAIVARHGVYAKGQPALCAGNHYR